MEWTREQRYRRIEEVSKEEYEALKEKVGQCRYRQTYHTQPITGLLNDPNGFSYFNGEYHLFYQWFPLGPVHGVKYWYHTKSKDLVHWQDCGIALEPDQSFDSHGVFSGTAIEHDEKLYLMYTGNARDKEWVRYPTQCLAIMDKEGNIEKHPEPVINAAPKHVTEHFRDPKVFEIDGVFYCIVGVEMDNHQGTIVYYESKDLIHWEYKGGIQTQFKGNGFMWECPDYFVQNGKGVLIISPQGMEAEGDKYQNVFQSGYLIGNEINFENGVFNHGEFTELDRGFEFYAPQTMLTPNGRRILVGWFGLPDVDTITEESGWAHCLTLPRELEVVGDKLFQRPIKELEQLRGNCTTISTSLENQSESFAGFEGKVYELSCQFNDFDAKTIGVKLRTSKEEETLFYYDKLNKKLVLDRSKSGRTCGDEYGVERKCQFETDQLSLQIFVDTSSIEIFVNDGQEVFSTRIFTKEESNGIEFFTDGTTKLEAKIWQLNN
ncbi:MAG: sucrose-6-phosphate hydrolase [Turicibacter sp.]|nr:sucrose-6-phosphate hydrolase [Turicibacter sp.]